jgi:hypothetical protein
VAWAVAVTVGGILVGGIVGSQTGIGIWAGLGFGLLAVVQFWTLLGGIASSDNFLEKHYSLSSRFLIVGITSTLGLVLGGCLGWLLKLSGVSLPS